jgi:hypothetical protein
MRVGRRGERGKKIQKKSMNSEIHASFLTVSILIRRKDKSEVEEGVRS